MKFILAEKKEMTQKFAADGTVIPVTRVVAGPCVVTQVKNDSTDGYTAVQLGFGAKRKVNKPLAGHLKQSGIFRYLKEFRITSAEQGKLAVGKKISVDTFGSGDIINVSGISKGRGFQGVVKRHHFHGSPASHGHKDQLRMPGSGGAQGPQHVLKGKRNAGHMGTDTVTVTNLTIVEVNPETNELFIKGAVPGPLNNLLLISGDGELKITEPVVETQAISVEQPGTETPVAIPAEPVAAAENNDTK